MGIKPRQRLVELLPAVWFLAALCMFLLCNNIAGFNLRSVMPRSQRRTQALSVTQSSSNVNSAAAKQGLHIRLATVSPAASGGGGVALSGAHPRQAAGSEGPRKPQVVRSKRAIMHRIKKKRNPTPSFISAYSNRTQKFVVREETPSMQTLLGIPLEMKLNYDTCARRSYPTQTDDPSPYSDAKLGIVVVVCNEGLQWVSTIPGGCQDKHIYLYSKCGVAAEILYEHVGERLRECTTVKMVPHTLVTDLTHTKMHADYLRHIISRYDELEPHMVFLKARVGDEKRAGVLQFQRHGKYDSPRSMREIVKVALTGQWAFLNIWPNRIHTSFEAPVARGRELCLWYKRYTCESECYSCFQLNHPLCYIPQSKSMFIVSRARIRSLPRWEYVALHQWLVSYKDTFSGWLGHRRRYVMERLWPVIFGCNNDAHRFPTSYSTPAGCKEHQVFGDPREHLDRASLVPSPPQELLDLGHMTWPQPANFTKMPYFPHIFTRTPPVSVVSTLVNSSHAEGQSVSFKAAVLTNPDAKLVLLVDKAEDMGEEWDGVEWAGRVEIHKLPVPEPPAAVKATEESLEDWKIAILQATYLNQLAHSEQDVRSSTGNVVFVKPHTMYYRGLRAVFDKRFTTAVSLQPEVDGKDLDMSTWFVHKDAVAEAARIMEEVTASYQDSMVKTFKSVLATCFQGAVAGVHSEASPNDNRDADGYSNSALASAAEDSEMAEDFDEEPATWQSSSNRCQLLDGTQAVLLLLPCEIFNAERDECPPDRKAKVASVLRSRDNSVSERMWAALQKRSRASIVQFFASVRQLPRRGKQRAPVAASAYTVNDTA